MRLKERCRKFSTQKTLSQSSERRTMHALSEEFDLTELRRARASSETIDLRTLEFGPD